MAGTLTQVLAEVMAGVAYAQLIRPGRPVIFGAFVTSIDMNSGAPTFGTPEASQIPMARASWRGGWGCRSAPAAAFCGSKLPDAQAAYESANTLNMALLAGVNFMLHACGWLEGGLVAPTRSSCWTPTSSGCCIDLAEGIDLSENGQAMDAIARGGAGRAFPRAAPHTQANFKTAFWRTEVLDYKPFETWAEEGGRDIGAARGRAGAQDAGGIPGAGPRPGGGRGAGRLRGAAEGVGARRIWVITGGCAPLERRPFSLNC